MTVSDEDIKLMIGNSIKSFRKTNLRMTREQFIDGITDKFSSIENIETGRSFPDIEFMISLANKFNEPVNTFIDTGFKNFEVTVEGLHINVFNYEKEMRIMHHVNIVKYCSLRNIPMEKFVTPNVENESIYENMGRLMHNERAKRGIDSNKFAKNIGMSKKTILNLEKANSRMSVGTLYRICSAFRIPVDYILVSGLNNKKMAVKYLLYDTFKDTDEKERKFLLEYLKIFSDFNNR